MSTDKPSLRKKSGRMSRKDGKETRPWGRWEIINQGEGYKVKLIEVMPGHRISLQYHDHRSEHWVVVAGRARVVIGNNVKELEILQSVLIPAGTLHRIENPTNDLLRIVEVQEGAQLLEEDIVRLEDDYNRVEEVRS